MGQHWNWWHFMHWKVSSCCVCRMRSHCTGLTVKKWKGGQGTPHLSWTGPWCPALHLTCNWMVCGHGWDPTGCSRNVLLSKLAEESHVINDPWSAENTDEESGEIQRLIQVYPNLLALEILLAFLWVRSLRLGQLWGFTPFLQGLSGLFWFKPGWECCGNSFFWWYFGISSSAHTQSRKCRSTTFSSLCTGFFL